MSAKNHYVEMMLKSLQKKSGVLSELLTECKRQSEIMTAPDVVWREFDDSIAAKQKQIDELTRLDEGFTDLYERVKEEFSENKEQYRSEIRQMQSLIQQITDISVQIQTEEERNRKTIEKTLRQTKKDIKQSKASVKAATDYYKSMSKVNFIDPQFMDQKK